MIYNTNETPAPIHSDPTISTMPIPLDQLERQLIAALKAVWLAQGKHKKIISLDQK